ncbi:unnamed protein product [Diamesa serratosioi]
MNDPTKRVDVEKSTLIVLKAELLRKQEEISKTKARNESFVPTKLKSNKNKKITKPVNLVTNTHHEIEDSNLLNKSKRILEAKAKYYDKMMNSRGSMNSDENCLVMFNKKAPPTKHYVESESSSDEDNSHLSEYVDFKDCFGRERKVLRKDLNEIRKKDQELSGDVELKPKPIKEPTPELEDINSDSDSDNDSDSSNKQSYTKPEDVGLKFQEQREEWKHQEIINQDQDFVHYQDVLFSEAREHGTGFYEFSADHDERAKQQNELKQMRESTKENQKKKLELKNTRDKIIADRVKAAKQRVRAKLGLPPEEEQTQVDDKLYDKEDEKKEREEEQKRVQNEKEKIREIERKRHVRPWDKAKNLKRHSSDDSDDNDNKDWQPRKEYQPMSQEQWNQKQRVERKQEFAPKYDTFVKAKERDVIEQSNDYYDDDRDGSLLLENERIEKSLFFTTKPPKTFKRRNAEVAEESVHENDVIPDDTASCSKSFRTTELPPPKTIESSIAAGLKFLRKQSDKDEVPKNKNKWCSTNEYN